MTLWSSPAGNAARRVQGYGAKDAQPSAPGSQHQGGACTEAPCRATCMDMGLYNRKACTEKTVCSAWQRHSLTGGVLVHGVRDWMCASSK